MWGKLVIILMVISLISIECGRENKTQREIDNAADSTLIFDGTTFSGWKITNFGPQGPVSLSGGKLILGMGDGCTGVTYMGDFPTTNYKVTLEAMRMNGNDFFCGLTFPAGKDPCTLIVGGWGGTTVGLSCIDGKDASENITTTLMKFEKKKWYKISLTVTDTVITAMIDTLKVVDFTINGRKLTIRPEVELSKPFGIATWKTTGAIRNVRVRRIKGNAQ
jgi:hypothetical protein